MNRLTKVTKSLLLILSATCIGGTATTLANTNIPCRVTLDRETGKICLTFPTNGIHWALSQNKFELAARFIQDGETICLTNGEAVYLSERHMRYRIVPAVGNGQVGVRVIYEFDGRSFGDFLTTNTFFVPTQNI